MSEAPELKLPPSAAGLWAMVRDMVDEGMASLEEEPARYRIGGGMILAAGWEHRESFDIDLTLPAEHSNYPVRPRIPPPDQPARKGARSWLPAKRRRATSALYPHLRLDKLASAVYTSRHDDPEPDFADPACT